MVWRVFRVKNKCVVTTQTELPNKWFLHDDCRFVTCFDVLSCDGILSSCHDFQIHTSYSSWFENGLRACIITLIWNLFACFLWNQIKQFLKYDFLNSPALLLKSLFCMLTCEGLFDDQFRKYVVFLNHRYFWNLFAFLLKNYVAVGLFYDENIWNNFLDTIFFELSLLLKAVCMLTCKICNGRIIIW